MRTAIPALVGFARTPWNKGRLTGQKRSVKLKEVWAIRVRLQLERHRRDLALFDLAIDSKLRGCDLVRLRERRVRRWPSVGPRPGDPAKNRQAGSIRDYRTNPSGNPRLAFQYCPRKRSIPVPEPPL